MSDFDDEKRKRRDEDSEEDLSFSDVDEDEEDEESEERQAPKRKKRKTEGRSDLVLLEAEEDDDEEDEDEIDGDEAFEAGEDIGGGSDTEENRQKARELFKNLSKDVDETEMKAMADRYRQSSRMVEDFDEFPVDANDALAIRQSLLPTTADPTMWCIRCQEGKERDVVRDLLAKFLIAEAGPVEDRLHIFSVHCVDGDKGRFYVESRKESHVRTALAQIPFVRLTSPFKLLKRMEMPRVLVVPEKAQLQEGQWVRVKNGIYRDDLAQVYIVSDNGDGKVTVRIVPRISKEQYTGEGGAKRARAESRAMRPAARPFRPEEVSDKSTIEMVGERTRVTNVGGDDEEKENQDGEGASDEVRWNGMWFKSGLLVKEFRLSGLHTSNIHPTQEEVGRFKRAVASWQKSHGGVSSSGAPSSQIVGGSQSGGDPLDDFSVEGSSVSGSGGSSGAAAAATGSSSAKSKAIVFAKGDHIQVTRGEYVSVTGIVTFATSANVEFRPDDVSTFGKKLITVPTVQVRKYFGPGLHVKILSGVYSGETGTITAVHDDTVTIYSDVVHKEIRANMADLQIAFSTGSGNTSLGSYHLFDLVQLGDSVGVIVDVERDGFQILGENGQTRYVPLAEVGARRNVAKASIGDAHNNYVNLGETVRILEGPYKDLTGILKHISRATVFIQCQNALVRDNRGLVCLRKHHIASVIDRSSSSQLNSASGPNGMNNASGRVIHGMGGGGAGPGAGARRIDPNLMRKEVIVKKGQWKGYRGMIKNASEREYTILLSTGSRTVKVPKEDVGAADGSAGHNNHHAHNNHNQNNDRFNDYNGSQTPMRHMTPRHPSSGGGGYDAWSSDSSRNGRSSNAMDEFDPNYRPSNINSASSNAMDISNGPTISSASASGGHHMPSGASQGSSTSSSSGSTSTTTSSSSSFLTPQIPQTPGFGLSSGGSMGSDYSRLSSVTTPGGVPYTPYAGSMMPPVTPGAGLGMAPPMTPGGAMMMPPMTPGAPSMPSSSSYPIPQTPGAPSTTITASSSGGFAYPSTPGGASLVPPSTPGGAMLGSSVLSGLGSLAGSQGSSTLLGSQGSSTSGGAAGLLPGGITASSLSSLSALTSNMPYTPGGVMIPSTPGAALGPSSSMIPPMTPGGAISGIIPSTPLDISSSSSSAALLGSSSSIPTLSSAATTAAAAAATTMDPDAWCQAGFEVFDATSSETPPPRFVILDPMKGTPLVKVEALRAPEGERTGVVSNITRSSLRLVPPSKKDRVAIITTGKIGILIGIDEQDGGVSGGHGIVKNPDDSEIQVLPMSNFAKVHSL